MARKVKDMVGLEGLVAVCASPRSREAREYRAMVAACRAAAAEMEGHRRISGGAFIRGESALVDALASLERVRGGGR